jgi:hypothetical protein
VKYKDPYIIIAWFQYIQEIYLKYGISNKDIYNFNKTGFMIGVIAIYKVVISANTIGRATTI